MAVTSSFAKSFGASKNTSKEDKPKANFWLNIGLEKDVNGEKIFLALPVGIPLDTQERLKETSSNKEFAQLQAARNHLLEQLIKFSGKELKPGEDTLIDLQVQIRRVRDHEDVSTGSDNPYAIQLDLETK